MLAVQVSGKFLSNDLVSPPEALAFELIGTTDNKYNLRFNKMVGTPILGYSIENSKLEMINEDNKADVFPICVIPDTSSHKADTDNMIKIYEKDILNLVNQDGDKLQCSFYVDFSEKEILINPSEKNYNIILFILIVLVFLFLIVVFMSSK